MIQVAARRNSNDALDWINKYQHSDHHKDRLMRTIVNYENLVGQPAPIISDEYRRRCHSYSERPVSVPSSFPSGERKYSGIGNITIHLEASKTPTHMLNNANYGMPPVAPAKYSASKPIRRQCYTLTKPPSSPATGLLKQFHNNNIAPASHYYEIQTVRTPSRSISLPSSPMTSRRSSVVSVSDSYSQPIILPPPSKFLSNNKYLPRPSSRRASLDNQFNHFPVTGKRNSVSHISDFRESPARSLERGQSPALNPVSATRRRIRDVLHRCNSSDANGYLD